MYFGVYSEDEVDSIKLSGSKPILIRIDGSKRFVTTNLYHKILSLNIDDVVSFDYVTDDFKVNLINSFDLLNKFLLENDFDEVIVHCKMGISRSPAIMICIAKMLGNEDLENIIKNNFKLYNKVIVDLFENYSFLKKEIRIDEVIFKGRFIDDISLEENIFYEDDFGDLVIESNKKKLKKK